MTDVDRLSAALQGRYAIEREVGEGGMATVYLAEDVRHRRKVALKVLRPELAATLGVERFLREIEVAANLQHPHILPLFDSGEAGGFLFYVMPYIEGESLRARLQHGGELPIAEAARILRDVVDALAYAHQRGVVHRDVKPDNVLLSGRHALVTDFGVAKAVSEATGRQSLTTVGVALGTPTYMAPEQATADPHVDFRADLYAVGVMAYEMLVGRPPFTGQSAQAILAAQVTESAKPVTEIRQSIPAVLGELVMQCLEKRPADRPTSAEVLLPQLEALATPSGGITPTSTMPLAAVDRAPTGGRARVRWVVAGVGVVMAAGLGYGVLRLVRGGGDGGGGSAPAQSIAVLPFENSGGDSANQVFTDGVQDEILTDLTSVGALQVTSRASVQEYRGSKKSVKQIGQELGVRTLLEGQVQRAGGQVRVNVQLVDAGRDRQIWADSYSRELTAENVFAIQGEIAQSVAHALEASFTTSQATAVEKAPTASLEALDWYHRGRTLFDARSGGNDTATTAAFARAVALDSTFAEAWAWLGAARSWEVRDGLTTDTVPAAAAVARARALAPSSPETEHAEAFFAYYAKGDYDAALGHFRALAAARPGYVAAIQGIGYIARRQGRWDEALDAEQRVVTLDPRNANSIADVGLTYVALRQFDQAEAELRRALILDPSNPTAAWPLLECLVVGKGDTEAARALLPSLSNELVRTAGSSLWLMARWAGRYGAAGGQGNPWPDSRGVDSANVALARALDDLAAGDSARARARADSAMTVARAYVERTGPVDVFGNLADGYTALGLAEAILGRDAQAVADAEKAVALSPISRDAIEGARSLDGLIDVHVLLGHRDEAIRLLRERAGGPLDVSGSAVLPISRTVIRMDPLFASIRNDLRVQELLADDAAWVVKR
jgi:TolB-like protein/Tfp pilus assembly protein PilF/tRNA A-37 threonylcarbamoyl transferase component Bud32